MSLTTDLTKLLNISTPIVAAPMAGASGGALAAQVTRGGGFGFMAAGYDSVHAVTEQLALARSILRLPDTEVTLPIGVGFLGWQLDQQDGQPGTALLSAVLAANVQAVWFAFGNDLHRWIRHTSSITDVQLAINEWKVDVIVVQGIESGGHGSASAPPLRALLSQALPMFPASSNHTPCLLAAGGIASGAHIAELLHLGISGVVLGTRFLLTPESLYTAPQRTALLDASGPSPTVRTMAFDHARGTLGWPDGIDGRALRNETVTDFDANTPIDVLRAKFSEGITTGDPKRMLVWAGTGVVHMNAVVPAKELVELLRQECLESLTAL